jgi:drug/metabolite transporter (DMT)-like permease
MIAASLFVLPMLPFSLSVEEVEQLSGIALGGLVYLGVLSSVVAYLLWYFALSRIDASRAAIFVNLQPVATALAAWWLLGDPLNWEFFVGGGLALLGLRITQTR